MDAARGGCSGEGGKGAHGGGEGREGRDPGECVEGSLGAREALSGATEIGGGELELASDALETVALYGEVMLGRRQSFV